MWGFDGIPHADAEKQLSLADQACVIWERCCARLCSRELRTAKPCCRHTHPHPHPPPLFHSSFSPSPTPLYVCIALNLLVVSPNWLHLESTGLARTSVLMFVHTRSKRLFSTKWDVRKVKGIQEVIIMDSNCDCVAPYCTTLVLQDRDLPIKRSLTFTQYCISLQY